MEKYVIRSSSTPDLASNSSKRPRDDSEQWQYPKRIAIPKTVSTVPDARISNRFSSLSVDKHDVPSDAFKSASKKKKPGRVPPIVLELLEHWTHQKLKDIIDKYNKSYHLEYKGNNWVKIQCYTPEGHQSLKDGLQNEKVSFHTFTRKDEKLPKVVIKGLPGNLLDSLPTELESLGFPGATATHIKTIKPAQCPPILIQLPSGTDMTKFKQIKYLANCVVTMQRYKTSNKIVTQCYRCQGFGHASRNCNRPARCVKCSLGHPTSECPTQGFIESVRCCNCQQDHPANYSQCKERLNYLDRIKSKRESHRNTIASTTAVNQTRPAAMNKMSFAQATTKGAQNHLADLEKRPKLLQAYQSKDATKINAPLAEDLPKPTDAATCEMLQILSTIKALKQEFIKCESFMDKVILILSHVGHYV